MTSEPFRSPAYRIIAVPFEKIIPNTYNPNSVAPPEMKLLYLSILEDGYTQPIRLLLLCQTGSICHCRRLPPLARDEGTPGYL